MATKRHEKARKEPFDKLRVFESPYNPEERLRRKIKAKDEGHGFGE